MDLRRTAASMPSLAPGVGLLAFSYAIVSPLLQPAGLRIPMDEWSQGAYVLLLIAVASLSVIVAQFSVRSLLPRLASFSSWQTWNWFAERAFRLFFWALPAFGIGCVVAMALCAVGAYAEQPYRMLSINAVGALAAGVTAILVMARTGND